MHLFKPANRILFIKFKTFPCLLTDFLLLRGFLSQSCQSTTKPTIIALIRDSSVSKQDLFNHFSDHSNTWSHRNSLLFKSFTMVLGRKRKMSCYNALIRINLTNNSVWCRFVACSERGSSPPFTVSRVVCDIAGDKMSYEWFDSLVKIFMARRCCWTIKRTR